MIANFWLEVVLDKRAQKSRHTWSNQCTESTGEIALKFPMRTSATHLSYERGFDRWTRARLETDWKRHKEGNVVERICKLHTYVARAAAQQCSAVQCQARTIDDTEWSQQECVPMNGMTSMHTILTLPLQRGFFIPYMHTYVWMCSVILRRSTSGKSIYLKYCVNSSIFHIYTLYYPPESHTGKLSPYF